MRLSLNYICGMTTISRCWQDGRCHACHDALAGIELAYSGINGPNLYTKEVPLAVSPGPILTFTSDPVNARALDKAEIADVRRWYVNAAKRAKIAGYDLICLYGAHGFGIIQHFLSRNKPAHR